MFWKAKIEDEDVEMYLNGLVSKESPTFRVVVEKIAKLKKTLKREVFWPASLKGFVTTKADTHWALADYRRMCIAS